MAKERSGIIVGLNKGHVRVLFLQNIFFSVGGCRPKMSRSSHASIGESPLIRLGRYEHEEGHGCWE
jgi:hypothetical protein